MQKLEDSLKYKTWKDSLVQNGILIDSIDEIHSVRKSNGDILFSLVKIDAKDPDGNKLLPIAMLRGNFVTVVTALIDIETKEKFFLMVKQRRIANGDFFYENPAGMCDSETDPWKVAIKEVEEETGLIIVKDQLRKLHSDILYTSGGLLDEAGHFFACDIELSRNEIDSYREKSTGAENENEFITTCILKEDEVFSRLKNTNGLLAMFLYKNEKNFADVK
jgi:ADP-sugar diphosphatase